MSSAEWHYEMGEASSGPHPEAEIERRIAARRIGRRTLVWRDGMDNWEPAERHFRIAASHPAFGTTPDGLYLGAPARRYREAIRFCLRNYVTFSGRASQSEFWHFVTWIVSLVLFNAMLDMFLFLVFEEPLFLFLPLTCVGSLAAAPPLFAAAWRRLHDTGRSGWLAGGFVLAQAVAGTVLGLLWSATGGSTVAAALTGLYGIAAFAYGVALVILLAQKGDSGPNRYESDMPDAGWHYGSEDGSRPHPEDEMKRLIAENRIGPRTQVWRDGMENWEPAEDHFEFDGQQPAPPGGVILYQPREERIARPDPLITIGGQLISIDDITLQPPLKSLYPGAPARGFGEAVAACLRKYVTFSGRASRSEFWYFTLFAVMVNAIAGLAEDVARSDGSYALIFQVGFNLDFTEAPVSSTVQLVLLVPWLAAAWRRFHDTGRSGWWLGGSMIAMALLLAGLFVAALILADFFVDGDIGGEELIPIGLSIVALLAYLVTLAVILARPGEPGPNRYG